MWFRRDLQTPPPLVQGARFRRARGREIETARVIAIVPDPAGIPHVRFSLQIQGGNETETVQRTLALDWFTTLYREPVGA